MRIYKLPDGEAPLFSLAGLPIALLMTLVLLWPMAATGNLVGFMDSNSYLKGGDAIWHKIAASISDQSKAEPAVDSNQTVAKVPSLDDTSTVYGRSITYAALLGGLVRTIGPFSMAILQTFLVVLAILAMINRAALERPGLLAAGMLLVIAFSQVAWLSVSLMPDILGAIVLIFASLLIARFDSFSHKQKIVLTLLAAFSVSSHYGNIPLAFAVVIVVLLWRYFIRGTQVENSRGINLVVVAGLFVVISAPVLNTVSSYIVLGETSMTPLRPPVVLARSLEDGPARWYVEEQCANNNTDATGYCDAFADGVPDNHFDFLWGDTEAEAVRKVRESEWKIVFSAALEYPLEQFLAIVKNTAKQFILVHETAKWMNWNGSEFEIDYKQTSASKIRSIAESTMIMLTALSGVILAGLLLGGRLNRSQVQILVIVVFGLFINALIFGALSAPAWRYQARVAWLLPLLMVLFLVENLSRQRSRIDQ